MHVNARRLVSGVTVVGAGVMLLVGTGAACRQGGSATEAESGPGGDGSTSTASATVTGDVWFTDRAQAAGIDFEHFNGRSGEFYFSEMMAPGAALFDFDNDDDLDVYLIQGQMLGPNKTLDDALAPPSGDGSERLTDRLFRNDLETATDGSPILRFTD